MLNDLAALYAEQPALFAGSVFVLGLVVGSFLNVVIYRLPIMLDRDWRAQASELLTDPLIPASVDDASSSPARFTLSVPRSACPVCHAPITALQNIPVVSWLALRGRCAACKTGISARYPVVELCTGLLSAWVAWHFGFGTTTLCALFITWTLVALTGIDVDHQLLPDNMTLPLMWGGLLASVVVGGSAGQSLPVFAAKRHRWRRIRVFEPLAGVSSLPPGDRQGRHGVRRLQALRRAGCLAGMETAALGHHSRGRHRSRPGHSDDRFYAAGIERPPCRSGRTWRRPAGWP